MTNHGMTTQNLLRLNMRGFNHPDGKPSTRMNQLVVVIYSIMIILWTDIAKGLDQKK
jgi:hypothetical protein